MTVINLFMYYCVALYSYSIVVYIVMFTCMYCALL